MSHAITHKHPLSWLLFRLAGPATRHPEWHDSRPDSIIFPREAQPEHPDYPDWLGYAPEVQKLLR